MKPDYQTTEFWLTLLFVLTSALGSSGLIDGDQTVSRIVAAIAAGLAAAGYGLSRAIVKSK